MVASSQASPEGALLPSWEVAASAPGLRRPFLGRSSSSPSLFPLESASAAGLASPLSAAAVLSSSSPPPASGASSLSSGASATDEAFGFLAPAGTAPRSTAEPRRRQKLLPTSAETLRGLAPAN